MDKERVPCVMVREGYRKDGKFGLTIMVGSRRKSTNTNGVNPVTDMDRLPDGTISMLSYTGCAHVLKVEAFEVVFAAILPARTT